MAAYRDGAQRQRVAGADGCIAPCEQRVTLLDVLWNERRGARDSGAGLLAQHGFRGGARLC